VQKPLMPKAIAIWLIENTALTFDQIADFCQLHLIEVEALANEESNKFLQGLNPVLTGEVSEDDIKRCEADPHLRLAYLESDAYNKYASKFKKNATKESKFKRKNKPEGILWILNHYPDINNYQISKLLNTTTNTVKAIRAKSYWNYKNLSPKNPVTLGLCSEMDLSALIHSVPKVATKE
jgi:hypothetical protein